VNELFAKWLDEELSSLESQGLLRSLTPIEPEDAVHVRAGGRRLTLFSSNDYLGLSSHPEVRRAAIETIDRFGMGPRGSPLICGYTEMHRALEHDLATLFGAETALLFPTGYAANLASIAALAGEGCTIFSDELNHASIIDGCRLARQNGARVIVYRHTDPADLEAALERATGRKLIVTESVFSMDGDLAPHDAIADLAERYDAALIIDESHATLVFDRNVRADVRMGTLSKAIGSLGGFVATSRRIKQWLLNRGRAYVFSTASPLPVIAAARAAIRIATEDPTLVERLWERIELLGAASPILPIVLGTPEAVMRAQRELFDRGFHVIGVRAPTVPPGTARLRITVSAEHSLEDVRALIESCEGLGEVWPVSARGAPRAGGNGRRPPRSP
jgi:8-amino-7-oxononanoate synthase